MATSPGAFSPEAALASVEALLSRLACSERSNDVWSALVTDLPGRDGERDINAMQVIAKSTKEVYSNEITNTTYTYIAI